MEFNDFKAEQYPVLSEHTENHHISINGTEWTIVWTRHAKNRTIDRHNHPAAAAKVLDIVLERLSPLFPQILEEVENDVTLRAFPYNSIFVLKIFKKINTLYVITYGNTEEFLPQFGDLVISLTERNTVTAMRWAKRTNHSDVSNDSMNGKKLLGIIT